jgi:hypothetical protein|tara:strand:+ start:365 stop:607 length:243 start_codon:yes stop_codon:yes gene_type:complete
MSEISYANWDGVQVIIKRKDGNTSKCKTSHFTSGGYEVVACNVVGDEVHVLTKLKNSSRPSRYHIVNYSGGYKGSMAYKD